MRWSGDPTRFQKVKHFFPYSLTGWSLSHQLMVLKKRWNTWKHRMTQTVTLYCYHSLPLRMGNSCCHELRALLTVDIQRWLVRQMAKMLTKDKVFQVLRQGRVTQLTSVWFLPSLFCSFSPLCSREGAYELQFGLGYL